jgi:RES domain-containing protein
MAHANIGKLPRYSQMIVIEIPESLKVVETVGISNLPGWDHLNNRVSREFGDQWIISRRSVALIVPSVVAKHDRNIVINQMHPNFHKITASKPESIHWDERLFKD